MDLRDDLLLDNLVAKKEREKGAEIEARLDEHRTKELAKWNLKIQFKEPTWVLVEDIHGGFDGPTSQVAAMKVTTEEFGVLRVIRDKKRNCCTIIVRGDYTVCDGHYECRMINVPHKLFKEIR